MPSAQKISIRVQLIFTFFIVMIISWILSSFVIVTTNREAILDYYRLLKKTHQIENLPLPPADMFFLSNLQMKVNNKLYNEKDQRHNRRIIFIIRVTIALLISLIAGIFISKRYTRPLKYLSDGAKELHKGNFDHRINIESNDEFGEMAQSMNEMASTISCQLSELKDETNRKKQLIADLAHELRSPIAVQKAMVEAMKAGLVNDIDRNEQAVQTLFNNTIRLEKLVDDLLVISRLDMNELPLNKEMSDINKIIKQSADSYSEYAKKMDVIVSLKIHDSIMVNIDPHRITQVIDNLLNNAISYSGYGAVVQISTEKSDENILIIITDNGIGIPAEDLPYIFDPFYRVDKARTPGNMHSGLGLRIAKGIIESHNGTVRLKSDEHSGTEVIITLPIDIELSSNSLQ